MPDWLLALIVSVAGSGSAWSALKWWNERQLSIASDERQVITETTADWEALVKGWASRLSQVETRLGIVERDFYYEKEYSSELLAWAQAGANPPPPLHPKFRVVD